MKIITLQKNLRQAVFAVNHIAQKNSNLPILNNILLSAKNGIFSLITTNLEIGITSTVRGKVEIEGAFTLDARIFSEYVGLLENDKVEISLNNSELSIVCGSSKTKIKGLPADEFPFIPEIKRNNPLIIKSEDFAGAVDQVIFASSQNENRPELSGVLLSVAGNTMTLAATDSYRLSEKRFKITNKNSEEKSVILPARTLQEVLRILGGSSDANTAELSLYISDNQCLFVIGDVEIISRLIDGQYPDYKTIIPEKYTSQIEISRSELIRIVKAASLFARGGVNDIVFTISKTNNHIIVSVISGQLGEFESSLTGVVNGEDNTIVLNYRYIIDVLNVISTEAVCVAVVDRDAPCVIKEVGGGDYTHLIMPIKK